MVAGRVPGLTKNGKSPMRFLGKATSFNPKGVDVSKLMLLPCRQCIGCRLERSRQWATRLMHEKSHHEKACFLTLTYDDDHLPEGKNLVPLHLTTFFKDLRARCSYYGKEKIKYFACGEYGDKTQRPHYHAVLYGPFGTDGDDPGRTQEEPARSGSFQFSHSDIGAVWEFGLHRYSELSFESAAYVARYVLKKLSGISAQAREDSRVPEFQRSSKGLGKAHYEAWASDMYPSDQVVLPGRGSFMPPPYYDRLLEKVDPELFARVKKSRQEAHEALTGTDWLCHVSERHREGGVRKLVTEQTLIRGAL